MSKKKWALIIFSIVCLLIIGIATLANNATISTGFNFIIVPDKVTVLIKETGKTITVNNNTKIKVKPGEYTLELSADGFANTPVINSVKNGEITDIYTVLQPVTDEARNSIDNESLRLRGEQISGMQNKSGGATIEEKYPFVSKLPIYSQYYTIAPCQKGEIIAICISLYMDNPVQRRNALDDLKSREVNPDDWTIIYNDN